jgi:hypothetical protein
MDPPDPHGGGGAHATTLRNGYVAGQLTELLGVPDTPTPSQWNGPGLLGAVIGAKETYNDENAPEQSQRAPNTAGDKTLSKKSQIGPIRTQRRLGRDPPRTPLGEISKQFKTLAGNVEKAFQEQTQVQEQTRQGDVKNLWTWVTDALNNMKAEQQIREENYIG